MTLSLIIVCVISVVVIFVRISAVFFKFIPFLKALRSNILFQRQPWFIALLILLDVALIIYLPALSFIKLPVKLEKLIEINLSLFQVILIIVLMLIEAKTLYQWLTTITKNKPVVYGVLPYLKNTINFIFFVLALPLTTASFPSYVETSELISKITEVLIIWSLVWIIMQAISAIEKAAFKNYSIDGTNDIHLRGFYTRAKVFKRLIFFIIVLFGVAATAMVFEKLRMVGTGIFASAGITTVVLGLAAQKTLGGVIAGIQIAITQPVRLNDLITIENETGTIEEINFSHIILKIWDLRRLVIPITYFLEKPFVNLSRTSTETLVPIYFYADYSLPVAELRLVVMEIIQNSPLWDKKTATLKVVEAQESSIKLRILVSATDNSNASSLKYEILEKLIDFLNSTYPQHLPKSRNI